MGLVLLGYGGAMGYLARNLGLEMSEYLHSFLVAWTDAIEPI